MNRRTPGFAMLLSFAMAAVAAAAPAAGDEARVAGSWTVAASGSSSGTCAGFARPIRSARGPTPVCC
jgi:hypothetical protein